MKQKQNKFRARHAALFLLLAVFLPLCFFHETQPTLSQLESQLVGTWSGGSPGSSTRSFSSDRTLSTSNGQFSGVWRIDNGQLIATYWQPFKPPQSVSLVGISLSVDSFWRSRESDTSVWEIKFSDNGKRHVLRHEPDKVHPDGKWHWNRVADK